MDVIMYLMKGDKVVSRRLFSAPAQLIEMTFMQYVAELVQKGLPLRLVMEREEWVDERDTPLVLRLEWKRYD